MMVFSCETADFILPSFNQTQFGLVWLKAVKRRSESSRPGDRHPVMTHPEEHVVHPKRSELNLFDLKIK